MNSYSEEEMYGQYQSHHNLNCLKKKLLTQHYIITTMFNFTFIVYLYHQLIWED